jgi:hypothetical protein
LSLNASAEVVASMNNQGGGKIVLTASQCPNYPNLYVAYSYVDNGKTIMGCWTTSDSLVMIDWSGDIRSYPANAFTIKPKGR